jgi:hypothetical protein
MENILCNGGASSYNFQLFIIGCHADKVEKRLYYRQLIM